MLLYPTSTRIFPCRAIPLHNAASDDKAIFCLGFIAGTYGEVKNVPHILQTSVYIIGGDLTWSKTYGPKDTAPYWTGPTAWAPWWTDWLNYAFQWDPPLVGQFGPFNPKVQAGIFWNHLYFPIGPFPHAGLYHLYCSQVQVLPFPDMTTFDPEAGPWPFAVFQKGDLSFDTYPDYPYDFYVQ